MDITKQDLRAAKDAFKDNPDVQLIGHGLKHKDDRRTYESSVVFGVTEKLPLQNIPADRIIPANLHGTPTDVQEVGEIKALSLTDKMRPCPPGYSIGHTSVTAGTLGAYVNVDDVEYPVILSNAHVIANSNDAEIGDPILQPGVHDGGMVLSDHFADLLDFVKINFGDDDKKKKLPNFLWSIVKGPANLVAALVGCPYRLKVINVRQIEQPDPNLVDAAIAIPLDPEDIDELYPFLESPIVGIRDLTLGNDVLKVGRTTELTEGQVDVVDTYVKVGYGGGKMAAFDNQLTIRGFEGEFSAPGDSGSAILYDDGDFYLGGLLFAGSSGSNGITIANKISDIVSLLGISV